jgi:hypothetical protein
MSGSQGHVQRSLLPASSGGQTGLLKRRPVSTRLHGVAIQKAAIFTVESLKQISDCQSDYKRLLGNAVQATNMLLLGAGSPGATGLCKQPLDVNIPANSTIICIYRNTSGRNKNGFRMTKYFNKLGVI